MRTLDCSNGPMLMPRPDLKGEVWELAAGWNIRICGEPLTIPSGFLTDGASIPRFLWRVCGHPMSTKRIVVAIVHDAIYSGAILGYTRKEADQIYCDALIERGFPEWEADLEYLMLRAFGASHWRKI